MAARHVEARSEPGAVPYLALVLIFGAIGGAAVSLLAFLLARYGPTVGDWSFRGNGALAAYTLAPALLAGGWTAAVLHHRGRRWIGLGVGAAAVGAGLALLDAILGPLFGAGADQTIGPVVLLTLVAWTVVAPLAAWWFSRETKEPAVPVAISIAAAVLWAMGVGGGLLLTGMVIPAGS
jgi:hypothetical protein